MGPPNDPCPSCGGTSKELVDGSVIYPHRPDLFHKAFWRCPDCEKSYVGCHPDTTVPMGTLADEETRKARGAAHAAFDRLWKKEDGGFMKRKEAYAWLAEVMGLEPKVCHISWFDADTSNYAAELSKNRFELGPQ